MELDVEDRAMQAVEFQSESFLRVEETVNHLRLPGIYGESTHTE